VHFLTPKGEAMSAALPTADPFSLVCDMGRDVYGAKTLARSIGLLAAGDLDGAEEAVAEIAHASSSMLRPLSGAGPNYLGCCTPTDKAERDRLRNSGSV
jgi:hypothetical protein